jgi:hypothetical protein
MLPINLRLVPLLADNTKESPDSSTSFPDKRLAVSFPGIAKFFIISVVTATPAMVL